MPITVARALGIPETGTASFEDSLKAFLSDKSMLLFLDNFEQLLDAALLVADLLSAAPGLKVLVTSRIALRLSGEQEYAVPPLSLPDLSNLPPLGELVQTPAVALFVARAQAITPQFQLTYTNAATVAQVCHRLNGIPLVIELAAARSKVFTPQDLLARLTNQLAVLTGGAQDLPTRQRTLRGALEWSYDLLQPNEQVIFRRVGVFVGAWTIEAAESICGGEVIDGLETLLNHSLLQSREGVHGETRFTMLELIREYSLEQLTLRDELFAMQRRHADYYLALAEAAENQLQGADQRMWLERLEQDHDNLRAALQWSLEHDPTTALRLSSVLWYFWFTRGYFSEGRLWLSQAVIKADSSPDKVKLIAKALHGAGTLAYQQGDYPQARQHLEASLALRRQIKDQAGMASTLNNLGNLAHDESQMEQADACYRESLALRRALGDQRGIAAALNNLGNLALYRGDYPEAGALYEESLSIRRALNEKGGIAVSLNNLGIVALRMGEYARAALLQEESLAIKRELGDEDGASFGLSNLGEIALYEGDFERAEALFAEALEICRAIGDQWGIGSALTNLGVTAIHRGDYGRAVALIQEGLSLKRTQGDRWGIAISLDNLGAVALQLGDLAQAHEQFSESLRLSSEIGDKQGMATSLIGLASAALAEERWLLAAHLLGAAETRLDAIGGVRAIPPISLAQYHQVRAALQAALVPSVLYAAESAGRALTPEQALQLKDEALSAADSGESPGLTSREIEILRLIAQGLTYAQVAERLVISTRTVDAHLRSIYNKLEVNSRHEATRYAVEHHLI